MTQTITENQAVKKLNEVLSERRSQGTWAEMDESDVSMFIEENYPELVEALGADGIESQVAETFKIWEEDFGEA